MAAQVRMGHVIRILKFFNSPIKLENSLIKLGYSLINCLNSLINYKIPLIEVVQGGPAAIFREKILILS